MGYSISSYGTYSDGNSFYNDVWVVLTSHLDEPDEGLEKLYNAYDGMTISFLNVISITERWTAWFKEFYEGRAMLSYEHLKEPMRSYILGDKL